MATVLSDMVAGSSYSENINTVGRLTRILKIKDLVTTQAYEVPTAALAGLGIALGDQYPQAGYETLIVQSIQVEPDDEDDPKIWTATVEYGSDLPTGAENEDTGSTSSFSSATSSLQTNVDVNGDAIEVGTIEPGNDGNAKANYDQAIPEVPKQGVLVEKLVPQLSMVFRRKETSNPLSVLRSIVGKLNETTTTLKGESFPPKTLLCTNAQADTTDQENNWLVTYEFQYRDADDWTPRCAAINPDTGAPWPFGGTGAPTAPLNAVVLPELYETAVFTTLNL